MKTHTVWYFNKYSLIDGQCSVAIRQRVMSRPLAQVGLCPIDPVQ